MNKWWSVLIVLVVSASLAVATNWRDYAGLPMSYLFNDSGYLQIGAPFTALSTTNLDAYMFESSVSTTGTWVSLSSILAPYVPYGSSFTALATTNASGFFLESSSSTTGVWVSVSSLFTGPNTNLAVLVSLVNTFATLIISNGQIVAVH